MTGKPEQTGVSRNAGEIERLELPVLTTIPGRSAESSPVVQLEHLDQLWFQVAGTLCNLTCRHCFISCSPHNHAFEFLSRERIQAALRESVGIGVKEYYFTGGEPFLHREMTEILVETLQYGPATVLTNGTVLKDAWLERLRQAEAASRYSLEFRVSIDGFSPETNDPIRGEGTFQRALEGVARLVRHGFLPIITAARTWDASRDLETIAAFVGVLRRVGYARPRLKILPTLRLGGEQQRTHGYSPQERVTQRMLAEFDHRQLICNHSRIVTDRGVHVCPILIDSPDSLMGETLQDARGGFELRHGACFTCYQYGAICSNASGASGGGASGGGASGGGVSGAGAAGGADGRLPPSSGSGTDNGRSGQQMRAEASSHEEEGDDDR